MKVFVVVKTKVPLKVMLEKFRPPRKGEWGASWTEMLLFLDSEEPA